MLGIEQQFIENKTCAKFIEIVSIRENSKCRNFYINNQINRRHRLDSTKLFYRKAHFRGMDFKQQ